MCPLFPGTPPDPENGKFQGLQKITEVEDHVAIQTHEKAAVLKAM